MLVEESECAVPVFKKLYVDLVQLLAWDVKDARLISVVHRDGFAKRNKKVKELRLMVQLLADDSANVTRL